MVVAGLGYWGVGFTSSYLLAFRFGLGAVGVWIGLSLGLAAVGLALIVRVGPCYGSGR
jgi:multidrug resistance protein, MATE family